MKKSSLAILPLLVLIFAGVSLAEETAAPVAPAPEAAAPMEEAPVVLTPPAEPATPVPAEDVAVTDNLDFISGEVSALDEAAKSVSVRLYGESEDKASDKTLTVTVDENTDITDGEQDRELKSLTAGTEVDVEYDPATNKATYIFVY